jgi:hypothetical protein
MADALITEANRRWWVLVAMTDSLSMILLDQTVVSVALPSIQNARPVALPPGRSRRSRTFSQSPSEQAAAAGKLPATESAELTGIVQDAALAGIRWAYIVGGSHWLLRASSHSQSSGTWNTRRIRTRL